MPDLYRRHRRLLRRGPVVLRLHSKGNPLQAPTRDIWITTNTGVDWSNRVLVGKRRKVLGALATGRPCFVELMRTNRQGRPYVTSGWPTHLGPATWYRDCATYIARVLEYVAIKDGYGIPKRKE